MKKLVTIVKKYWRESLIVIGVYLFASGIVGFGSSVGCSTGGRINPNNPVVTGCEGTVTYRYPEQEKRSIAFGSCLIAIGILAKGRKDS